jgi:hypothetical protein
MAPCLGSGVLPGLRRLRPDAGRRPGRRPCPEPRPGPCRGWFSSVDAPGDGGEYDLVALSGFAVVQRGEGGVSFGRVDECGHETRGRAGVQGIGQTAEKVEQVAAQGASVRVGRGVHAASSSAPKSRARLVIHSHNRNTMTPASAP